MLLYGNVAAVRKLSPPICQLHSGLFSSVFDQMSPVRKFSPPICQLYSIRDSRRAKISGGYFLSELYAQQSSEFYAKPTSEQDA